MRNYKESSIFGPTYRAARRYRILTFILPRLRYVCVAIFQVEVEEGQREGKHTAKFEEHSRLKSSY